MANKKITLSEWLQTGLIRLARVHFLFVFIYAVWIIASDAWHLITPQLVLQNWTVATALLAATAVIWYLARNKVSSTMYYRTLIYCLILFDIFVAGFNIYTQRGMASRAVMLFGIPIVSSAILLNRAAIYTTACLSTATYIFAAVRYFVLNFNEGYKVELYAEVGLYCAVFFVLAAILSILIRFNKPESDLGL